MKNKLLSTVAMIMLIAALWGCGRPNPVGTLLEPLVDDLIAHMSQSFIEAMNDGMSDIGNAGVTGLSYRVPYPGEWLLNPTPGERLSIASGALLDMFSAGAATINCPGGGSIVYTDPADTWNSDNSSFSVVRTFSNCGSPGGMFTVSGDSLVVWSNLLGAGIHGAAKIQAGSVMAQAPVGKRYTRSSNMYYITVEGNGESLSGGGLSGNSAHTITWTAVSDTLRSFRINTDLTRTGYTGPGIAIFKHRISTPDPLSVTTDIAAGTRTISGSVKVEHVFANITMTATMNGLVIPVDNCIPSSGTATIDIAGSKTGSGSIIYNSDMTATYSYTDSKGNTFTGNFTLCGCQ